MILEYREIAKLQGTYVEPLPSLRDSKTGRIHASFHQAVTATGRLSSSDQIAKHPRAHGRGRNSQGFHSVSGNGTSADYSQIELRILAHVSEIRARTVVRADEDVHRRTASEIFGVLPGMVDDRQGIAKRSILD